MTKRTKICETCNAFQPGKDGGTSGQCRAKSATILTRWITPEGSGWQGGWPPTNAQEWCREHETKPELVAQGVN